MKVKLRSMKLESMKSGDYLEKLLGTFPGTFCQPLYEIHLPPVARDQTCMTVREVLFIFRNQTALAVNIDRKGNGFAALPVIFR